MDQAAIIALANLLAILLPIGTKVYDQIQQANSGADLKPIADVLAAADQNWDAIVAAAKAELDKLPPQA